MRDLVLAILEVMLDWLDESEIHELLDEAAVARANAIADIAESVKYGKDN